MDKSIEPNENGTAPSIMPAALERAVAAARNALSLDERAELPTRVYDALIAGWHELQAAQPQTEPPENLRRSPAQGLKAVAGGVVEQQLREAVARAVCLACEEDPDRVGDARGNSHRWEDYLPCADAAIAALESQGTGPRQSQASLPERGVQLAAEHEGMRVDYNGVLRQVRAALEREPGLSEMVRQLHGHLTELGKRWYAGDCLVVDELLQLYCIGVEARRALTAGQVKAHG